MFLYCAKSVTQNIRVLVKDC